MSQGFIRRGFGGTFVSGVISVNGFTGVVALTADNIPETASRFFVDQNIRDALFGANSPSAGNVFITANDITGFELLANKGVPNGYVPLNAGGTIDAVYLNLSALNYKNSWDASTNIPALADGIGTAGDSYIVGVAGTQDLGSGPITFSVGDLVIYNSLGVWQKITGVAPGVSSVNGFTGAVVLDADDISETGTRYFQTAWQKQSADAAEANQASPTDRYALLSELNIIVGSSFLMPENFSNGETLGDGTLKTLSSLGYTNVTASAAWPRVTSTYGMNVLSYSIDWVAWQEMELFKRDTGATAVTLVGTKGYCPSQSILLAKDMTSGQFYKRGFKYVFNGNGSAFANRTGTNFPIFDRYPVNQAEANGLRLAYGYIFRDCYFYGNNSNNIADCGIRLGASSHSVFENCGGTEIGVLLNAQFCLELEIRNMNIGDYGLYGVYAGDGTWPGSGTDISQSNNIEINGLHCVNGSGKTPVAGLYCTGNRNIIVNRPTFEGYNGSQHHILYDSLLASTVKNLIHITNMDIEAAGASRAAIRIKGNSGQASLMNFNNQVSSADLPVLVEVEEIGWPFTNPMTMTVWFAEYNLHTGWKFRQVGAAPSSCHWDVYGVKLNNDASLVNAANWDTVSVPSSQIPSTYRYVPVM